MGALGTSSRSSLHVPATDEETAPLRGPAAGSDNLTWAMLPPLPQPDPNRRHQEFSGISLTFGVVALLGPLCEFTARVVSEGVITRAPANVAWLCAAMAVCCHVVVLRSTSGVLARTRWSALPIPAVVSQAARSQTEMPVQNIREDGHVYCVRCLVWRPVGAKCHHCRVCQRCSMDFDHHCHILGRCIRGTGFQGNILPFRLLLVSTVVGVLACLITLMAGVLEMLSPQLYATDTATAIAASWSPGMRVAVALGGAATVTALLVLGLLIVGRMCKGAQELTERARSLGEAESFSGACEQAESFSRADEQAEAVDPP